MWPQVRKWFLRYDTKRTTKKKKQRKCTSSFLKNPHPHFQFFWGHTEGWDYRSSGNYGLTLWGTARVFSNAAAPFYTPTRCSLGFQFLYVLVNTGYFLIPILWFDLLIDWLNNRHPDEDKVILHCGFDLHFFNN